MVTIEVLSDAPIATATQTTSELANVIADIEASPIGTTCQVVAADDPHTVFTLTKVPDHTSAAQAYDAFVDTLTSKDATRIAANIEQLTHWAYDSDHSTVRQLATTVVGYVMLNNGDDSECRAVLRDIRPMIGLDRE